MTRREASAPIGSQDGSTEGRGRVALVTGASSGIGRCHAELLAAKGYDVIPVARRGDRLEALRQELESRWGVQVRPIVADLADPEVPAGIARTVEQYGMPVDVLVNNAGLSMVAPFAGSLWEDQERFLRVMALAPTELTHRFLPGMVARGWGRIISVSSIAATFTGSPNTVLYAASKAMMNRMTEGIAAECAGAGVNCTVSMPGFTRTELLATANAASRVEANPLMRRAMMAPERVAREAYDAVMDGRRTIVHGRRHLLVTGIVTHTPPRVRRGFSERFMSVLADA